MNADEREDEPPDDEDESDLVPLGTVLQALDAERSPAAQETARDLLRTQRTPPHAVDAERALLGGCILDPTQVSAAIDAGLVAEHFWRPQHQTIWGAILGLVARREAISAIFVVEELLRLGQLDAVGGAAAISQLEALLPTAAHVPSYAKLVAEKAALRRLLDVCVEGAAACFAQDTLPSLIATDLRAKAALVERSGRNALPSIGSVVDDAIAEVPGLGGVVNVFASGLHDLDVVLAGGFGEADLVVAAGRPSAGKTQWALDVAGHHAIDLKRPILFHSLEMPRKQLVKRLAGTRSQVDPRLPRLRQHERERLIEEFDNVRHSALKIDDTPGQDLSHIRRTAHRVMAETDGDLGLVIVDYLQLVKSPREMAGKSDENKAQAIGAISAGLKELARELSIPVVALSQLSRKVEDRPSKKPIMSDLRDSGAIEQDADLILLFYRPVYYLKQDCPPDKVAIAEIEVAKYRNGEAAVTVECRFEGKPPRFTN